MHDGAEGDLRHGPRLRGPLVLIGRDDELAEAARLLATHRLVTLVGPGGVGKTRLAAEVLAAVPLELVGYVELAAVASGRLVVPAILWACGIRDDPGCDPLDRLLDQLPRWGLLVLDNCEHLITPLAELVAAILRRLPDLRVLTTSRSLLALPAEVALPVGVLRDKDAVQLFLDRARQVRPDLPDHPAVGRCATEICRLTDGLPLAIELAAAHARSLPLADIRRGIGQRLDFLRRPGAAGPERHRSVEASIRWSLDLVGERERQVLQALSVVDGRFTLSAALAVAGLTEADPLQSLVGCCLVQFDPGDGRYALFDSVRRFAADGLAGSGQEAAVHGRLLRWVVQLARSTARGLEQADEAALERVDRDLAAVQAALARASASGHGRVVAAEAVADLTFFWSLRGRCAQGRDWAELVSATLAEVPARLAWAQAFLTVYAGDVVQGAELAARAAALAAAGDDPATGARALVLVGMAQAVVDPKAAVPVLEAAVELADAAGEDWAHVEALQVLSFGYQMRSDHAAAMRSADRALPILHRLGHPQLLAWDAALRAETEARTGRYREAEASGRRGLGLALTGAVRALVALGRHVEATGLVDELRPFFSAHPGLGTFLSLDLAALLPQCWRDPAGSAAAALRVHQAAAVVGVPTIAAEAACLLAAARLAVGDSAGALAAADAARRCGAVLDGPQSSAEVVFVTGAATRRAGAARVEDVHAALTLAQSAGLTPLVVDGLDLVAGVALDRGRPALAASLHASTTRWRHVEGVGLGPLAQSYRPVDAGAVAAALGPDDLDAAGLGLELEGAVHLAVRGRDSRGRPRFGWDSLTPTERDVVRLAAEGLSNPAIGERLLMGPGTVRTHLRSVFGKLGVASRAELAGQAARRDLQGPGCEVPQAGGGTGPTASQNAVIASRSSS